MILRSLSRLRPATRLLPASQIGHVPWSWDAVALSRYTECRTHPAYISSHFIASHRIPSHGLDIRVSLGQEQTNCATSARLYICACVHG
ncbi:hypothetical protein IF2G_07833 [Cordyceps javanica]|nr:hypothetical protein IF2G_07833 [Cordyceps javanica]